MTLAEIYAQVPRIRCKGKCQESCGPIAMSAAEARVIRAVSAGKAEFGDIGGIGQTITNFDPKTLHCPLLGPNGRCAIYEHRPVICRIWAVTKEMRCPHGCRPDRWLSRSECHALLDQAKEAVA